MTEMLTGGGVPPVRLPEKIDAGLRGYAVSVQVLRLRRPVDRPRPEPAARTLLLQEATAYLRAAHLSAKC
jgi:hypothetical protein